ncbi:MAG: DUF4403 family protein [Bacteroidia bacterium]
MKTKVILPLHALEELVNRTFEQVIYEGTMGPQNGGIGRITVTKKESFRISAENNFIITRVPVHIKVSLRNGNPGIFDIIRDFSNLEKTHFDIAVTLRTRLRILPGWKLETRSEISYYWEKKPVAGPLNILQISELVRPHLEEQLATVAQNIDNYIGEEVKLGEIIAEAWHEITRPAKLALPFPAEAKLVLPDKEVPLFQPKFRPGKLVFQILPRFSINIAKQLHAGTDPEPPGLRIVSEDFPEEPASVFEAKIAWEIFDHWTDRLEIPVGRNRRLVLSNTQFQGTGNKLEAIAGFEVKGWGAIFRGRAEIIAESYFNPELRQVSFRQVWIHLIHGSPVVRGLKNVWGKNIERKVNKALQAFIMEQISLLPGELQRIISTRHLSEGLELSPVFEKITLLEMAAERAGVTIRGEIEGELRLQINRI